MSVCNGHVMLHIASAVVLAHHFRHEVRRHIRDQNLRTAEQGSPFHQRFHCYHGVRCMCWSDFDHTCQVFSQNQIPLKIMVSVLGFWHYIYVIHMQHFITLRPMNGFSEWPWNSDSTSGWEAM